MSLFNIIDFSRITNNAYNKQEPINKMEHINKTGSINKQEPINKIEHINKPEPINKMEDINKQEYIDKRINNWFCNYNKNSIFYKNISIYICKK
jgi:hypothetical protein